MRDYRDRPKEEVGLKPGLGNKVGKSVRRKGKHSSGGQRIKVQG